MKITEIERVTFTVSQGGQRTKWGYGEPGLLRDVPAGLGFTGDSRVEHKERRVLKGRSVTLNSLRTC